jgi:hypothetical protein
MRQVEIEWLYDEQRCETCGLSVAEGARVTVDGHEAILLRPKAHCFGGEHWSEAEVYQRIFNFLGCNLTIKGRA